MHWKIDISKATTTILIVKGGVTPTVTTKSTAQAPTISVAQAATTKATTTYNVAISLSAS